MALLSGPPHIPDPEERIRTEARDRFEVARRPARSRILVVDDEPLFCQTMSMLLSAQHEVIVEGSGYGALRRLLADRRFELVLCDLSLPDLAGPELYAQIARRDPKLAARFVFVTGGAFTPSTREFLNTYRGPRLEKPFQLTDLERLFERARLSA